VPVPAREHDGGLLGVSHQRCWLSTLALTHTDGIMTD
jgi:hypothetical protein